MYAPGQLHYLRVDQGRSEEMVDTMRRLVRDYRAIPSLRAMLAETCAESGLEDEARRELRAMADDETAMLMMNASWSIGMYSLSMACSRLGEADIAQRLYEPLLAYEPYCHVAFRASYSTGSVARALGLLAATAGNTEQAERHLARAVEVNEKIGALCQLARARHDYGLLLHNAGRADEAEPHLASARALAERLGMRGPKATR
jgi:tetratricopeptide (TPR) repeat protein